LSPTPARKEAKDARENAHTGRTKLEEKVKKNTLDLLVAAEEARELRTEKHNVSTRQIKNTQDDISRRRKSFMQL
jgi:hypothetical protein